MAEDDNLDNRRKNGKLNLSQYTPEEIDRRLLETAPPPEPQAAKARRKESKKTA